MYHKYIDHEYKNLIVNIFKYGLMYVDLPLTNFDNQHFALTNIINTYLQPFTKYLRETLIFM